MCRCAIKKLLIDVCIASCCSNCVVLYVQLLFSIFLLQAGLMLLPACWCGTFILVCDQPPRSTQPGHSFMGRHMSTSQRVVMMPCSWGIKAGMVRVWVADET